MSEIIQFPTRPERIEIRCGCGGWMFGWLMEIDRSVLQCHVCGDEYALPLREKKADE